jgi:hypothetical protein
MNRCTSTDDPNAVEPDAASRLAERTLRKSPPERGLSASDLAAALTGEDAAAIDAVGRQ